MQTSSLEELRDNVYTVKEVATFLKMGEKSVYRLLKRNVLCAIEGHRHKLIKRDSIVSLLRVKQ